MLYLHSTHQSFSGRLKEAWPSVTANNRSSPGIFGARTSPQRKRVARPQQAAEAQRLRHVSMRGVRYVACSPLRKVPHFFQSVFVDVLTSIYKI